MIVDRNSLDEAYKTIRKEALGRGCSVVIFVSAEGDSLCAARILTSLLRSDCIAYKLQPVEGYMGLKVACREVIKDNEDLRSVVMINCGGIVDLIDYLSHDPEDPNDDFNIDISETEIGFYVLDSHRPYDLENARSDNTTIRLLHDTEGKGEFPTDFENSDFDADFDTEDEDSDDEYYNRAVLRRRLDDDNVDEITQKKREKYERQEKIKNYYKASFYGTPAALLMYELSAQLVKDSNDLLWYALVGITEQFIYDRIDRATYQLLISDANSEVEKHNETTNDENNESKINRLENDSLVDITKKGHIDFSYEYRFMLLRHWTLYDSLYHSSYLASRLGIWGEKGQRKLQRLLMNLGIPLKQCKQPWTFMDEDSKRSLKEAINTEGKRFGLDDCTYGSFCKRHCANFEVSAADMVYGIQALLDQDPEDEKDDDGTLWERNFNHAYDALSSKNLDLLKEGIDLSTKLQKAIVRQGVLILKKRSYSTSGTFRFSVLDESSDLHHFTKPIALSKLALFIMDSLAHQTSKQSKPFVLCSYLKRHGAYLVVGVPKAGSGQMVRNKRKNTFGTAFEEAAKKTESRIQHDGFETAICIVQKDDLEKFLEFLSLLYGERF